MSSANILPCKLILRESFGEVIEKIGCYLMQYPPCSLRNISTGCGVSLDQVKTVLCVLLKQNIAKHGHTKRGIVVYSMRPEDVLIRVRFPRFVYFSKTLYGDYAESLVEILLGEGQQQMSLLVERVKERLNKALPEGEQQVSVHQVKEKFVYLVKTHFLQRCIDTEKKKNEQNANDDDEENPERSMYDIPKVDLELLARRKRKRESDEGGAPAAKRSKIDAEEEKLPDEDISWRLNYARFDQYTRDQELIEAMARKIDTTAGEILRTILRLSEAVTDPAAPVTNPISATEIYNAIPREICSVRPALDQYLSVMSDDSTGILHKVAESGGGMYSINFKKGFKSLAVSHIESVVQERFGSKCLRIFRLVMLKKHLEQKQIEESAMIPAKEAKEMLYTMFGQHFLQLTEIPKTPDHAPARTFYLFSVDINQISRMLLQICYKTMFNLMRKREYETKENRRILDKQQRVNAILASLRQQNADDEQKAEVEEMITPAEHKTLTKIKHAAHKLEKSELQLDTTIFVLEKYLHYDKMS